LNLPAKPTENSLPHIKALQNIVVTIVQSEKIESKSGSKPFIEILAIY